MKYDASLSAREMRKVADLAVATTLGLIASAALQTSMWLTVAAAFLILRPRGYRPAGSLWKKPTITLAFLSLLLVWLASDWSSYQRGVDDGVEAASAATQRAR